MSTSTHAQRKQSVPNWKRKQGAHLSNISSSNNTNIGANEKVTKQKSVAHFSTLINQPTVSPAIPYEVLICAYLIAHLFLQYYNIYSTNFYNYDFYLMFFALSIISLRLLFKFISNHHLSSPFQKVITTTITNLPHDELISDKRKKNTEQQTTQEYYKYRVRWRVLVLHVLALVLFFTVIYLSLHIFFRYGLRYSILSFIPFFVYIILFCGPRIFSLIQYKKELISQLSTTNDKKSQQQQQQIQQRSIIDAPLQVKLLLYSTFEWTYYSGIFPIVFAQDHVYFDNIRCITQVLYMVANILVLLLLQLLSNHFLKFVSHTHFFGYWQQLQIPPTEPSPKQKEQQSSSSNVANWTPSRKPYSKGSVVTYDGKMYVAMGEHNYGVPGQFTDRMLFILFCEKPDRSHCYLICIQSAVTLSQLMLFLSSTLQTTAMDATAIMRSMLQPRPHFEMLSWEACIVMLLFNLYICHLCIWVRRETLRFLLFLAQTTSPSTSSSNTGAASAATTNNSSTTSRSSSHRQNDGAST